MCLVVIIQVVLDVLPNTQAHQAFDELFIDEPSSSVFLLVLFEEGIGRSHIAEVELLADIDPSALLERVLGVSEAIFIKLLAVVVKTA